MSFISPISALIAAGITVPLLVMLYFLKLRRRALVVPSTLLWKKSIQDLQVNSPFQKLRNNLLLWLQLLLLALLLLAMARPATDEQAITGSRIVLVVDQSASMSATDVSGTRLQRAKEEANRVIEAMPADAAGMVIAFAERAQVVQSFTGDKAQLRRAIDGITPTQQRSRLDPAIALIEPQLTGGEGEAQGLSVFVFSDGRTHADGGDTPALPGTPLTFVPIGSDAPDNLAIVAASARRDPEKPEEVEVFARLANFGPDEVTATVTMTIDGRAVSTRRVRIGGVQRADANTSGAGDATDTAASASPSEAGERSVVFALNRPGPGSIELRHDHADALSADDSARLELTAARRLRVLLVSEGNPFLSEGLKATDPDRLEVVTPSAYEARGAALWAEGDAGFDVVVFDRYRPASLPMLNSLSFGEAPPVAGLERRGSVESAPEYQRPINWSRSEALMRYVAMDDVIVRRPGRLVLPDTARVLIMGTEGPMAAAVEEPESGRTHVVVSFDVLQSRWPLNLSFTIFLVNVMDVLGLQGPGAGGALSFQTGTSASVPVMSGATARAVVFDGPVDLTGTVRAGRVTLPAFDTVGWYETTSEAVPASYRLLAVNLVDGLESDLRPASRVEVASAAQVSSENQSPVRREVWWWLVWPALGLLLVEWWVYVRRMGV